MSRSVARPTKNAATPSRTKMAMECWREALSRGVSYRSRDVVGARRGNQAAVLPDLQFIDQPGPLNLGEGTLVRDGIVLGGRIGGGRQLHGFTPRAVGFGTRAKRL